MVERKGIREREREGGMERKGRRERKRHAQYATHLG